MPGTATTYNDTVGLVADTNYDYRVRATDAVPNLGPYSNVASATTPAPDTQAPTVPGNLTATAVSWSQIDLGWTAATDNVAVTEYRVERCLTASCTFAQIGAVPGTATTYSDTTGLVADTSYDYRVRATDAVPNLGPYSNVASATTPATIAGLVAGYGFDEGAGPTAGDVSVNLNDGDIGTAVWTTQGRFGNALDFNGSDALVTVPDSASLDLSTGMTLEAWVYPTAALSGWRDVIFKSTDIYYLEASSSRGRGPAGGGTFSASPLFGGGSVPVATWTHLALTYDQATLRLYVGGVEVASRAETAPIESSTGPLSIGGDADFGQYFEGIIDEVRIYNRALSGAEIQADMNTPVPPPGPDTQAPTMPGNLTATAVSGSQIDLGWTAATDNVAVTEYRVERCLTASCTFAQIGAVPGTATTYSDTTGLVADTSYDYRVRATDAVPNLGPYSNVASATTPGPDTQAPTMPGNLTATAVSGSQIDLGWTAATDNVAVTEYRVERCLTTSCSFAQIGAVPGTATTYSDTTGLVADTGYDYRVRATDAVPNLGPYSNVASATTPGPDTQAPTMPGNLTATAVSWSQIDLGWTAATDNVAVTEYRVERCLTASCSFAQIGAVPGTATTYSDTTGLVADTGYDYRVRATDAVPNLGPYSNVASATTPATIAGLVAAYGFETGTGPTAVDDSGNFNDGSLGSAVWATQGRFGNALDFNGSDALVTVPDSASLDLSTGMTLEAWVYPTAALSGWRDVIFKSTDIYYLEASSSRSRGPAGGGTFSASPLFGGGSVPVATWTHLALTYDQATLRLYVGGVEVASRAETAPIESSTGPLSIGGDADFGQYFEGIIDEVRIYNRALSGAEIQADMNTPVGGGAPPGNLPATVTRGPYLQMPTPTSVTVRWRTDELADSVIRFGTAAGSYPFSASSASQTTEHEVIVGGLQPDTQYFYTVGTSSASIEGDGDDSFSFITSPLTDVDTATRIWVTGDAGTADANAIAVRDAYKTHTGSRPTDLWLTLGDIAYDHGTDPEYQAALFDTYPELLRQTPIWPTYGNHDGESANAATESGPYFDIFTLPRFAEVGGFQSQTEAYYSFDYGIIHFISLDSFESDRTSERRHDSVVDE